MDSFLRIEQKDTSINNSWVFRHSRLLIVLMAFEYAVIRVIIVPPGLEHLMPGLHSSIRLVHHLDSLLLRFSPCLHVWINCCETVCFGYHGLWFGDFQFDWVPVNRRVIFIRLIKVRVTAQVRIIHFTERKGWTILFQAFSCLLDSFLIECLMRIAQITNITALLIDFRICVLSWLDGRFDSLDRQHFTCTNHAFFSLHIWNYLSHHWWLFTHRHFTFLESLESPAWRPCQLSRIHRREPSRVQIVLFVDFWVNLPLCKDWQIFIHPVQTYLALNSIQLHLRLFFDKFLFLLLFKQYIVLDLRLLLVVKHVEFLDCSTFLRWEIKVVIPIMLVLALPLFRQLTCCRASSSHGIDVLLHARPGVERDIHYV